jgi:hypothetical protein
MTNSRPVFGVSRATAARRIHETIDLLSAHAPKLQAIADPDGNLLWVSGAIRGSVHDTKAAQIWQLPRRLREHGLFVLGDKGYQGIDHDLVVTPYKGRGKPEYQKAHNRLHARLRGPGERLFAELKKWRVLRKLSATHTGPPRKPALSPPSTTKSSKQVENNTMFSQDCCLRLRHWLCASSRTVVMRVIEETKAHTATQRHTRVLWLLLKAAVRLSQATVP